MDIIWKKRRILLHFYRQKRNFFHHNKPTFYSDIIIFHYKLIKRFCYLQGGAIQAFARLSDKSYFDSLMKINGCYRLSNYICEKVSEYMLAIPHSTAIRIGKAAKFEEIPDVDFPRYYFNLIPHEKLSSRLNIHTILTGMLS